MLYKRIVQLVADILASNPSIGNASWIYYKGNKMKIRSTLAILG